MFKVLLVLGRQAVPRMIVNQMLKPYRFQRSSLEASLYLGASVAKVPVVDHPAVGRVLVVWDVSTAFRCLIRKSLAWPKVLLFGGFRGLGFWFLYQRWSVFRV